MLLRQANLTDLPQLNTIENNAFSGDKISPRQMKRFINSPLDCLLVAEIDGTLAAYALVLFNRGTRLARLYSIAVASEFRGRNIAFELVSLCEKTVVERGFITLRLEVRNDNIAAKNLYLKMGYKVLKTLVHYYDDLADGVRMHKRLDPPGPSKVIKMPLYVQTTPFTCGAACLMMAINAIKPDYRPSRVDELSIWREATTIFMTSGHGGCSVHGLALAALKRGLQIAIFSQSSSVPFIDSVRDKNKKAVITLVHNDFCQQLALQDIVIHNASPTIIQLKQWIDQRFVVLLMISTYRFNGEKGPHWVVLSGYNEQFMFIHDPFVEAQKDAINAAYVPISQAELAQVMQYGKQKQVSCLVVESSLA
ncbi:GNAT family N-acetyltransferase/peptidase C39 family protein [Shewanella ulleungensis]|jgi:ribosomal protein S18 acetylase RimI-like enzyme|uniref:Acetyltransferase n=1 Tax=Shewanella ulleungensis TaxID=2282699 RepID=A0ABQ2QR35_9GAMM|nr:GNAT family N-acetyltransferase/peptidase C39 family protein [Shewanella ulleungensis]MCL1151543.1 GNAT family N-acetyltransferase/peptidase C39 family protein [Shewanella ulleungensis]GGP89473.1 acetyltransferase [Shewanella ulleungensis]